MVVLLLRTYFDTENPLPPAASTRAAHLCFPHAAGRSMPRPEGRTCKGAEEWQHIWKVRQTALTATTLCLRGVACAWDGEEWGGGPCLQLPGSWAPVLAVHTVLRATSSTRDGREWHARTGDSWLDAARNAKGVSASARHQRSTLHQFFLVF